MLTRFAVKNYKCLADVDIPLTPIHVLIGENDTGKTSLLEAMYAFHRSSTDLAAADTFFGSWTGSELVYEGASEPRIELSAELQSNDSAKGSGYGFCTHFFDDRPPRFSEEWCECDTGRFFLREKDKYRNTTALSRREKLPHEKRYCADLVAAALGRADFYRLDARTMAIPAMLSNVRKFRLDEDGFGLASLMDDVSNFDPELFISIRRSFCRYFDQFKSVRLETVPALDRSYTPFGTFSVRQGTGKGIFLDTKRGKSIRAQQASDGAILFLGLLTLLHLPEPPRMLLLEEPETGIYPKRLQEVITLLREFIGDTSDRQPPQIVLTTHSPYVLTFFQPEEVTFMTRQPDGSVRARPLRDAPNIRERMEGGFYLGELWYNLTEAELFHDE